MQLLVNIERYIYFNKNNVVRNVYPRDKGVKKLLQNRYDIYSRCLAVFCPAISRTGTFMRIIEASLHNKIVITTRNGASSVEGLNYEGILIGENIFSFKKLIENITRYHHQIKTDPALLYNEMVKEMNELYKRLHELLKIRV